MKLEPHTTTRDGSKIAKERAHSAARGQVAAFICPTVVAMVVGWRIFASLGDVLLSLVLGCVAFITLTPLVAAMSDRDRARQWQNK
ncbi:hypothetical protein EIK56_27620 [Sphingomonas sp. C8-2]|nr:hypothetical protein EIK56_27620 [Sphingomonas sp. C8-2]